MRITYSANDLANKLWKAANFYDEFGLSPKTASLLYDASNFARSCSNIIDKNDKLKTENSKLQKLVTLWMVINKHMSLCATTDCKQCPVKEECEESVHLEGLLGIDPKELSWRVQKRMTMTLETGTCKRVRRDGDSVFEYCSECGGMLARWLDYDDENAHFFCPNCGCTVVNE